MVLVALNEPKPKVAVVETISYAVLVVVVVGTIHLVVVGTIQ